MTNRPPIQLMSKLIIYVDGKPSMNGYRIREFKWSDTHKCYIYNGQEFEDDAFNAAYAKSLRTNEDLRVRVRVVALEVPSAPVQTAVQAQTFNVALPPHEVTWQEAEAVLRRVAPHRLKKKTGRPPKAQMAA